MPGFGGSHGCSNVAPIKYFGVLKINSSQVSLTRATCREPYPVDERFCVACAAAGSDRCQFTRRGFAIATAQSRQRPSSQVPRQCQKATWKRFQVPEKPRPLKMGVARRFSEQAPLVAMPFRRSIRGLACDAIEFAERPKRVLDDSVRLGRF
jgi:hypothetical protein